MKSKKRHHKWQVKPPRRIHKRPGVTLRGIALDGLDVAGELPVLEPAAFPAHEYKDRPNSRPAHAHD